MTTRSGDNQAEGSDGVGAVDDDAVPAYRRTLTADQLDVLDSIWAHHLNSEHGEWPPKRQINVGAPGRARVMAAIEALPPGAWFEESGNTPRYGLTLLGVLLTSGGQEIEDLAARFLGYMRDELVKPSPPSVVTASGARESLALSSEQLGMLGRIIQFGGFYGNTFSGGPEWSAGIPGDADELTEVSDFHRYVRDRAVARAASAARWNRGIESRPSEKQLRGDFWFVEDPALRKQLAADRQELLSVHGAGAVKSTVILAGGLLEGMLLDVLSRRIEESRAAYARLRSKAAQRLDRWVLGDLIDVASELSILPRSTFHISHVLREFRDLIHPGRQLREGVHLTKDEATLAVTAVNICFRELGKFADT